MVTHILKHAGYKVDLACTDAVYLDSKRINEHVSSGVNGASHVLTQLLIDAAVLETSRGSILETGKTNIIDER